MFSKILVPFDGSPLAKRAIPFAIPLARASDGQLLLLHAVPAVARGRRADAELDLAAELDRLVEHLREVGVTASVVLVPDEPAQAITSLARERGVDLIAMATHGRGGLGRWLYGSVADHVLRHARVPVLLVPPSGYRETSGVWPARILVPLDGSARAEAVLAVVARLAVALQSRLLLLRVAEQTYNFDQLGFPYRAAVTEQDLTEADRYLEAVKRRLDGPAERIDVWADRGDPTSRIAAVAREKGADLIAMATHGRGGLARLALGSVATGTLRRADVPLLLIRPPEPTED